MFQKLSSKLARNWQLCVQPSVEDAIESRSTADQVLSKIYQKQRVILWQSWNNSLLFGNRATILSNKTEMKEVLDAKCINLIYKQRTVALAIDAEFEYCVINLLSNNWSVGNRCISRSWLWWRRLNELDVYNSA